MKPWYCLFLLLLSTLQLHSQFLIPDTTIKVFQDGKFLPQPWAGAFNQPQFSFSDFNQDGQDELLVFDRQGQATKLFNWDTNGQSWRWMPGKGKFFPQVQSWLFATEVNCDGWPDLIFGTPDSNTASLWLGTGEFMWEDQGILLDQNGIPVYVLRGDIPALGDVDGDGDIDLLAMNEVGTQVVLYESQGTCDSLGFSLTNECWGGFSEGGINSQIFLNTSCFSGGGNPPVETNGLHAGSSLTLADIDSDGLLDMLIGDLNQNTITYVHNGGVPQFAVMDAIEVGFPSSTQPVQLKLFPAVYAGDFDQDGDIDIVAAPNDVVAGRNQEQIWWYENSTSSGSLDLSKQSENWLGGEMIDIGERSKPAFCDINGDGLKDLIIGNFSLRQDNENSTSSLYYFLNTGTASTPAFDLLSSDWLSISTVFNPTIFGLAPTFGDVDQDGDEDMVLGEQTGKLHLFINSGGPGNPANFSLQSPDFLGIDVGKNAVPTLEDITGDGIPDLLIGSEDGKLFFAENDNTVGGVVSFQSVISDVGQVSGSLGHNLSPVVLFNPSGDPEILIGTREGQVPRLGNIAGNLSGTFSVLDSSFGNLPLIPFGSPAISGFTPGQPFLFIGNWQGGIQAFKQSSTNSAAQVRNQLFIQSIETEQGIHIIFPAPLLYSSQIELYAANGTLILADRLPAGIITHEISWTGLSTGFYFLKFTSKGEFWSKKVLIRN